MKILVLLDGVEVKNVCSLNTQEGTLVKFCLGERGPGHPFEPHLDPDEEDEICTVTVQGAVHVDISI